MDENIGVGVAHKPEPVRDPDSAQNELPAAAEPVDVKSVSHTIRKRHSPQKSISVRRRLGCATTFRSSVHHDPQSRESFLPCRRITRLAYRTAETPFEGERRRIEGRPIWMCAPVAEPATLPRKA